MIIFGKQPSLYVLEHYKEKIQEIYIAKNLPQNLFKILKKTHKPIVVLDSKKAQALAHGRNHQGILLKITDLQPLPFKEMLGYKNLLVLSKLSDVGNIGTIIRTAYCLGVDGVIIADTKLSSNALEGIARSSAGAFLDMPFCIVPYSLEIIHILKIADFVLLGTGLSGEDVRAFTERISSDFKHSLLDSQKTTINPLDIRYRKWALFMGNESEGLSHKIYKKMDTILHVPMKRAFNSLNVAQACAILLDRLLYRG